MNLFIYKVIKPFSSVALENLGIQPQYREISKYAVDLPLIKHIVNVKKIGCKLMSTCLQDLGVRSGPMVKG